MKTVHLEKKFKDILIRKTIKLTGVKIRSAYDAKTYRIVKFLLPQEYFKQAYVLCFIRKSKQYYSIFYDELKCVFIHPDLQAIKKAVIVLLIYCHNYFESLNSTQQFYSSFARYIKVLFKSKLPPQLRLFYHILNDKGITHVEESRNCMG